MPQALRSTSKVLAVVGVASLLTASPSLAQQPAPEPTGGLSGLDRLLSMLSTAVDDTKFVLTIVVLMFTLICLLMQLLALRRVDNLSADDVSRSCAIPLVIGASIVLLVAGYSSQQIAPAFGLFGTIVGYLLGRGSQRGQQPVAPADPTPPGRTTA